MYFDGISCHLDPHAFIFSLRLEKIQCRISIEERAPAIYMCKPNGLIHRLRIFSICGSNSHSATTFNY